MQLNRSDLAETDIKAMQDELAMLKSKVEVLESALSASAGTYYDIDLTRGIVPGVMRRRVDGELCSVNESAGMPEDALYSQVLSFWESKLPEGERDEFARFFDADALLARYRSGDTHLSHSYWMDGPDGLKLFVQHVFMYEDRSSGDIAALTYMRDMTEQHKANKAYKEELDRSYKSLQDALLAAQHANKAKTAFLSNISHDIRTPMNAIIGFTSLAASHLDNKERLKEYLGKITTSSDHLLSLINDVLDMSRIESGKVKIDEKPLHLPDLLHDIRTIVQPSIASKQLEFLIDTVDVRDEDIIADRLRLNQILLNTLSNGIKFNRTRGLISLRVKQTNSAPAGYANYQFIIRDTGIGMKEGFKNRIFEAFAREEDATTSGVQGTGLGMAITKNIVELMGGTIEVESEEGQGSEFVISLTFRLSGEPVVYEKIDQLQGLRVLVADDDTDTCLSVVNMLTEIGMRPEWTVSGKEAVIRSKHAVELGDEFSAFIIDWLMPDMNGIETVRRIRKVIGESKPIIILTAYDWSDIEEEAREAGVTAFCEKPLFMSELRDVLSKPFCVESDDAPEQVHVDLSGKKILLVEDNELNLEIAQTILEEAGLLVDIATDGLLAVDKVIASKGDVYDLVLMDVQMPNMNGYEATLAIRSLEDEELSHVPIIAMTADAFDEAKEKSHEVGMDGYLAKPIKSLDLLNTLGAVFAGV